MILTNCAACAAPLAHTAPRCIRCQTRYCNEACQRQHWERGGHEALCRRIKRGGGAEQYYADKKYKEAVAVSVDYYFAWPASSRAFSPRAGCLRTGPRRSSSVKGTTCGRRDRRMFIRARRRCRTHGGATGVAWRQLCGPSWKAPFPSQVSSVG